jgi:PAS domain S-box-containing protein
VTHTPPSRAGDPSGREHDNRSLRDERFRLLVPGVTDYAVFMLDPDGRVVCWNTGAERVFGYTDPEVVGHHYALFFTPGDVGAGDLV